MSSSRRLIIFTRYPQPGQTKTRLIPALGAVGAANLQRQLTEHTLSQVNQLCTMHPLSVEIWFSETASETADQARRMRTWLGDSWIYRPQQGATLGERLIHAIQTAFAEGMQQVVVIGIDCPDLNAQRIQRAFAALEQADVVLGPASDGGYYLIGLRSRTSAFSGTDGATSEATPFVGAALFQNIDWGSAVVFQQTVAIANQLGFTLAGLDELTDIDRPDDLPVWEAAQKKTAPSFPSSFQF